MQILNDITHFIKPNMAPLKSLTIPFKVIEDPLDQLFENIGIQLDKVEANTEEDGF